MKDLCNVKSSQRRHFAIRKFEASDVEAVAALDELAFGAGHGIPPFFLRQAIDASGSLSNVATVGGEVVGYCISQPRREQVVPRVFRDDLVAQAIGVHPSMRGSGIAQALIAAMTAQAISLEMQAIHFTVQRTGPVRLYRRLGFAASHIDPDYFGFGKERIVMTKDISLGAHAEDLTLMSKRFRETPELGLATRPSPDGASIQASMVGVTASLAAMPKLVRPEQYETPARRTPLGLVA